MCPHNKNPTHSFWCLLNSKEDISSFIVQWSKSKLCTMLILSLIFKLFVTLHFSKRMTGWKNNKNDFIVPLMIYQLNELKCNWKANWQRKFCVGVCFHFKRLLFLVFIRGGKENDYIKSIEYYCSINTMTINN